LIDYLDDALDIVFTYDDTGLAFPINRLNEIERGGHTVGYVYDRFGRVLEDGSLAYTYDKNGNRTQVTYPGGVAASYTYDFADRQITLTAARQGKPDETLVASASYEPGGPLTTLTLGNGLLETRVFNTNYYLEAVLVANASTLVLDWQYATNAEGNVTAVLDGNNPANERVYTYQDYQDYLIQGNGPWGTFSWTYDRVGNRLSETRDGVLDTYEYLPNAMGGNSGLLLDILLGNGGTEGFEFDAAGDQTQVASPGTLLEHTYDEAGMLTRQARTSTNSTTEFLYDGRGFLRLSIVHSPRSSAIFCDGFESGDTSNWGAASSGPCLKEVVVESVYSSNAVLHALHEEGITHSIFYFAGRPVAQLDSGSGTFWYLTTDHLGAPILMTSETGGARWEGGFDPFGADFADASQAGVFLRLPGQWSSLAWNEPDTHYNVQRWYSSRTGRYTTVDPDIQQRLSGRHLYAYADAKPLSYIDPLGSRVVRTTPFSRGFVKCFLASKNPDLTEIQAWLQDGDEEFEVLIAAHDNKRPAHCPRNGNNLSCWQNPGFLSSGKIWIDLKEGCNKSMEGFVHETIEAYAALKLKLSASALDDGKEYYDPILGDNAIAFFRDERLTSPAHHFARTHEGLSKGLCCGCTQ